MKRGNREHQGSGLTEGVPANRDFISPALELILYNSCPDQDYCRRVHFSNAITCDKWISFGDKAEDAHCTDIFDDPEPRSHRSLIDREITGINVVSPNISTGGVAARYPEFPSHRAHLF